MTSDHQDAEGLLRQGIDALKAGDRPAARSLIQQSIRLNAGDERAWLWLAGAVDSVDQRRQCLQRVLTINPQNQAAQRGLADLSPAPTLTPAPAPMPTPPVALSASSPAVTRNLVALEASPLQPVQPPAAKETPTGPLGELPAPLSAVPARRRLDWRLVLICVVAFCAVAGLVAAAGALLLGRKTADSQPTALSAGAAAAATRTPATTRTPGAAQIRIEDRGAKVTFPDKVEFHARASSSAGIARVVLEYGVDKQTCGSVTAKAFPDFKPSNAADVTWTWEMRQSGSQPPGTTIWYRWRVFDAAGGEQASDEKRITWLDRNHRWQEVSKGQLTLHWYNGDAQFAQTLIDSAVAALEQLKETTGVAVDQPIHLYIYGSTDDMRDAVLYEPGWTGGLAYPDYNSVIIGISPEQLDWGKRTEAHELTHVLVGHLTFSCLGSVPTWLNEGIAMYGEGGPEQEGVKQLQLAIADDQLIAVRALSGGFSEDSDKANLSYSQSYSIVNYLVTSFGKEKLRAMFEALRDGTTTEAALQQVYDFGIDGLEDRWRASVGAKPRHTEGAAPTASPVPSPVPTYRPVSGVPLAPTSTP